MIISILGMAGEFNGEETTAYYGCKSLKKESKDYRNSTDVLLKNYDDDFYLLGTEDAITLQKRVLDTQNKSVKFLPVDINNLDEVFEKVFELISKANNQKVILDITHGFRDQSISAIFSATLHLFLNQSNIEVIFAKQVVIHQKYEYMLLNDYINLTQLSLLLTGFIRTLNFVNSVEIDGLNTLAFENFSKALLSNDFAKLQSSYLNLSATLTQAKKNPKFAHLKEVFGQIENELKEFKGFDKKEIYEKYMILAKLMSGKNYYLLSLTYLFESVRLYGTYSFYKNRVINDYAWNNFDMYGLNRDVMSCIGQKEFGDDYRPTFYDRNNINFYEKNSAVFELVAKEYIKLRELRNSLTHINNKTSQPNIKKDLEDLLNSIEMIISDDVLKNIKR